jgi:hypothetical protein
VGKVSEEDDEGNIRKEYGNTQVTFGKEIDDSNKKMQRKSNKEYAKDIEDEEEEM